MLFLDDGIADCQSGIGRGSRSSCAETLANDHFLFREREERAFGVGRGLGMLTEWVFYLSLE